MKVVLFATLLVVSVYSYSQNLDQFTKNSNFTYVKAPEGDLSMINLSGLSQQKSAERKALGYGFMIAGSAMAVLAANQPASTPPPGTFTTEETNPLYLFSGIVGLVGFGLHVSSIIELRRSGMYLQAHANGIIITF